MDVIWTAEFAAGQVDPAVDRRQRARRPPRASSRARCAASQYQDKIWAIPFTTNTQLLWYRKDKVKTPPKTWDEMIDQAAKLNDRRSRSRAASTRA